MPDYTEPRFNGYVGMPAALYLDQYARHLRAAFGVDAYLVGSALKTKEWHDLDVRVTLSDDAWAEYGFGAPGDRYRNAKWVSLCLAYSVLGQSMTGHIVDFQLSQDSWEQVHCNGAKELIGLPIV
jgi:hypothetical protein